jgi:hypothetical protein
VGRTRSGSIWHTLIVHWDGSAWALVTSPVTSGSDTNVLNGVACSAPNDCWAVGDHALANNLGFAQPVIEHWNGASWTLDNSLLTAPNQQDAVLNAVTCVGPNNCWAVGFGVVGNWTQTLVEHYDGTSWIVVTSANTSARESNTLNAITCTAANDCWAVGNHDDGTPVGGAAPQQSLTLHWDGTAWNVVASPNATTQGNVLTGVSCTSTSDCKAVGYYTIGLIWQTFVLHWNGSGWTQITSPNPNDDQDNRLFGVSCNSPNDCWAVGYFNAGENPFNVLAHTLALHWDGSAWTTVPSPNRENFQINFLNAITCLSSSECWAMGVSDTPNAITLAEHYLVLPRQLTSLGRDGDGVVTLVGAAAPGASIQIEATADLSTAFAPLTTVITNASGLFTLIDNDSAAMPKRFYRARYQ